MSTTSVSTESVKEDIRSILDGTADRDFEQTAVALLRSLGYVSERTLNGQSGKPADLIRSLAEPNFGGPGLTGTQSERTFLNNAQSVRILFQFTGSEIQARMQPEMFDPTDFDTGNARSFLFAAVELNEDSYPRGQYATFTRELNKHIQIPMVVLFRTTANRVTLAFVHRRPNRRDASRDVLGSVSLIREIDYANPHRAHLDILAELSLPERLRWMDAHGKPHNFDGLLDAWLAALDTEELNRRFYRDLFVWFERAVKTAKFPDALSQRKDKNLPAEEHVIRLITRLMFVWFIKEKELVAKDLFVENRVGQMLKDYDPEDGDSYYRAVLQNLFFATLNTEIDRRDFSNENNNTHRDFSLYRYRREIADPDGLLALFAQTPFINGGLFDCLDSFDATGRGGYRIDCFSDNPAHSRLLSIPNRLFFSANDREPGLIDLFDRYKFTVEENTPAEQEVALDPELLGKVFENLLAAYNPETRENARKQTGSYYTPRVVVDYMVDQALVATLAQRASPADGDADFWQERLRYLLDYGDAFADAETLFTEPEREAVVRAIAETKALDPAVGSGAFPMSVLHKLTLALRRLDDNNELWERVQREEAASRSANAYRNVGDDEQRQEALAEVENTFRRYRESDFGRKLYLIQNTIYGVDIQPVATQIAKLRFFISLAIEQQPNGDPADNYGIRPLPNLETRFVAADTLLALEKPAQLALGQTDEVQRLESELAANRERYFHANNRQAKLACRDRDKELRQQLAAALESAGFPAASAGQVADWEAFDQNANPVDWFDSEYMFNVPDGFDVVIANPPYVQLQKERGKLARQYQGAGYKTFVRTGDVYYLFYERGTSLLRRGSGHLCFISSNQWMRVDSGKVLREFIDNQNPVRLVNLGAGVFDNVTVNTNIVLVNRAANEHRLQAADVRQEADPFPPSEWTHIQPAKGETWTILTTKEQGIKAKMEAIGTPLKEWEVKISRGIITGLDKAFVVDAKTRQALIKADPKTEDILNPILRGRDIERYQANCARFLVDTHNGYGDVTAVSVDEYPVIKSYLDGFKPKLEERYDQGRTPYNLRNCAYYSDFAKEKIVWGNLNDEAKFAYAPGGTFVSAPSTMLTPYSPFLLALLNSSLVDWYFRLIAVERDGGYYEYKPMFIERLPIPKLSAAKQRPLVRLVEGIMKAKAADAQADTREAEAEIDRLVYGLYGLTEEEIATVSGKAEFQVVPNKSGLAPGVTPDNLKDIIQDLEDEELLEKLGQ